MPSGCDPRMKRSGYHLAPSWTVNYEPGGLPMNRTAQFQMKQMIKQAVQNVVLPACYRMNLSKKVNPKLVVFADAHHNSRPAAMDLLYRSLKKSGEYRIVEHYLDYGTAGAKAVAKHSMNFMKLYAQAGYVVICDNFLPVASCSKRNGTHVIQLWHACGCYKKFGYDAKDDIPEDYHGANVYRNADLVTVSGQAAVAPFASAMRLPESCVRAIGVSRTDLYFKSAWREQCRKQFYEHYPDAKGKKVVLWAPTFRGNAGMPELDPLDLEKLQKELGGEYYILASLHPHMKKMWNMESGNYLSDLSTEALYPIVDVMIADYSSLIYEYLLFRKPLVLYVPDLEEYRKRRGFYMDIEQIPGKIVLEEAELAEAIRSSESNWLAESGMSVGTRQSGVSAQSKGSRMSVGLDQAADIKQSGKASQITLENFLSTYMGACDGQATERIVEWFKT